VLASDGNDRGRLHRKRKDRKDVDDEEIMVKTLGKL